MQSIGGRSMMAFPTQSRRMASSLSNALSRRTPFPVRGAEKRSIFSSLFGKAKSKQC